MFQLTINTDNDAFADGVESELSGLLHEAAQRVRGGELSGTLRDYNGNRCGEFRMVDDQQTSAGRHSRD